MIRHGRDTEVLWAEAGGNPELVYGGEREKVGAFFFALLLALVLYFFSFEAHGALPFFFVLTPPLHTTTPPQAAGEGRYWCDQYVAWSKTGAYLLTYHRQGVALWGGPNFDKVARLAHHGVA